MPQDGFRLALHGQARPDRPGGRAQPCRENEAQNYGCEIRDVSDTRSAKEDTSGDILAERIEQKGHKLLYRNLLRDDKSVLVAQLHQWIDDEQVDVIITTGGTGLTGRDITPEALNAVKDKDIPGFGELFRYLSIAKIGTSTVQSRACAVVARGTYIFALPGSNGAVKDGWDGILDTQLDSRHRPCNFVELIPRLLEK